MGLKDCVTSTTDSAVLGFTRSRPIPPVIDIQHYSMYWRVISKASNPLPVWTIVRSFQTIILEELGPSVCRHVIHKKGRPRRHEAKVDSIARLYPHKIRENTKTTSERPYHTQNFNSALVQQ
ncbi:hypothetical protein J6590_022248 [Homalodisca vitripennis]|nr:hypothetical protein J6590_022248 [Homalodisca vitripennis]